MDTSKSKLNNGRLKQQIRKALPVYLACFFIFLVISAFNSLSSPHHSTHRPKASKRSLISQHFLTASTTEFPRKIWQTWKVGPLAFEERDSTTARTWTTKNPGHRYEVLTDFNALEYVESHYGPNGLNRPDIVRMYTALNVTIVKADLLRYLIMYAEGGIYADIDVEAQRPVAKFIPNRYDEEDVDMVIGVEIDQPEFAYHPVLGKKSMSFCQWTFMCKPRLRVMMRLIENIMSWLDEVAARQHRPISEITLDFDEVLTGTGPSAFTAAVLAEMTSRSGHPVTWDLFHEMPESKVVSKILVLTVEAFAAGQGHSDSGNHNARTALVKHHFHASGWPTNHPRYSHPIHGQVESCNWDLECVRKWDEEVAKFKALSVEEQENQIKLRETLNTNVAPS